MCNEFTMKCENVDNLELFVDKITKSTNLTEKL